MQLDRFPRLPLGHLPTPLEPAPRLSAAVGGPRLWIKRDDCTGLATGGNKTRKLEFLLGEARARGASHVVTFGAVQSNHARQAAAACARLGLACDLVLARRVVYRGTGVESGGNVLIDRLCGARLHFCAPADSEATFAALQARLLAEGARPYVIPTGGSNAVRALGYVAAAAELHEQAAAAGFAIDAVFHATSSGGTQAGLLAGFAVLGAPVRVIGVNVHDTGATHIRARVEALLRATLDHLGRGDIVPPPVELLHDQLGRDYGLPTRAMVDAVKLAAATEGVVLDPVYSGKAMAALLASCRGGAVAGLRNVVFVHTGGSASLGVYARAFAAGRRADSHAPGGAR
jgi:L-cysteate sulfo-lyase